MKLLVSAACCLMLYATPSFAQNGSTSIRRIYQCPSNRLVFEVDRHELKSALTNFKYTREIGLRYTESFYDDFKITELAVPVNDSEFERDYFHARIYDPCFRQSYLIDLTVPNTKFISKKVFPICEKIYDAYER